jgi:ferritin-like metal-binding protein YciE
LKCKTPKEGGELPGYYQGSQEVVGDMTLEDEGVLDAVLIAAAQAVEHYEITRYGSLTPGLGC